MRDNSRQQMFDFMVEVLLHLVSDMSRISLPLIKWTKKKDVGDNHIIL